MNAFLRARTAFGFEYLTSFRAEHSDADRDITGIEGLLFVSFETLFCLFVFCYVSDDQKIDLR